MYNESLRFAEEGSVNTSLSYANRALNFLKLKKHYQCLADIELANYSGYPQISKLDQRKALCLKSVKEGDIVDTVTKVLAILETPKLSYDPNDKFPCLANVLNIECSGRGEVSIVAKEDIAVGQIIAIEESFSHSLHGRFGWKCYICLKQQFNLVPCKKCTVAMYDSFLHKYECGKIMKGDRMEQMRGILVAINTFSNADEVMDFVDKTVKTGCNEVPDNLIEARSKYRLFLKLPLNSRICKSKFFCVDNVYPRVYQIYKFLLNIPRIGEFFKSLKHQRFLMYLIAHHIKIGYRNTRIITEKRRHDLQHAEV